MAINKGWNGHITMGAAEMAQINNWEISFNGDALEKTSFTSIVKDRTFDPGLRSHTVTFSGYAEDTDTAQDALTDLMASGTANAVAAIHLIYDRATTKGWQGSGIITNLTEGTPVDGLATFNGSFQVTGGLSTE